jgi:uncharacterized membrane protein
LINRVRKAVLTKVARKTFSVTEVISLVLSAWPSKEIRFLRISFRITLVTTTPPTAAIFSV